MKHPPYHLRPNKAIDRLFFLEAIRFLERFGALDQYTYYGLGGPYLEDFRILYETLPKVGMVSIEKDEETFKRQGFHLPCGTIRLKNMDFKSFLARYEPRDEKSIFWLDYTNLSYGNFDDFMALLSKVSEKSMIKISLRCQPNDFGDKPDGRIGIAANDFRRQFEVLMPDPAANPPRRMADFAYLLQQMARIAAQRVLSSAMPLMFQPLSSFYYADAAGMFTLTGVICRRESSAEVRSAFEGLAFPNLDWAKPKLIDVPVLSTKERLHLQRLLPCSQGAGPTLLDALGYLVDTDRMATEKKLEQYAEFHRYYPYFMEGIP